MRWHARPTKDRVRLLVNHSREPVELLAEGFAFKLDETYSFVRGPRRTGDVRPDTGRRVSKPGEFAQEQLGVLRSGIYYEMSSEYGDMWVMYKVGIAAKYAKDPARLEEYLGYIEGRPKQNAIKASRYGLERTGESKETHNAMMKNLKQNLPADRFLQRRRGG
jgi:hypothetical protein